MGGARVLAGKGRSTIWVTVGVLVCLAGVGAFMELSRDQGEETFDLYSTISPAPDGAKALYLLMTETGYDTSRSLESFDDLEWDSTDVIVMLQPLRAMTTDEEGLLFDWLEDGGTLLLAGEALMGGAITSRARTGLDDPLAYHHPDEGNLPKQDGQDDWTRERSDIGDALVAGVSTLEWSPILVSSERKVEIDPGPGFHRRGDHLVLATRNGRSFVEISTAGDGLVVKIADVDLLINKNIEKGRNLSLVLNVLEQHGGEGRVVFDEGHRRMVGQEEPSVWDVLGPAAELAFLQLILATIAALVALGWRKAPALPETQIKRRRALQQVEALAGMLEHAGAATLAIRLMHGRTRRLWAAGRFLPAPGRASSESIARQHKLYRAIEILALQAEQTRATRRDLSRYMKLFTELKRGETSR